MKEEEKVELQFKAFKCPSEGGAITGLTVDGKTVNGTIQSNRKLKFTLEAANGEPILFFEGNFNKEKKTIIGHYGLEEGECEW